MLSSQAVPSGNSGIEFLLPEAIDTLFQSIAAIKANFAPLELKALLAAHKDVPLSPEQIGIPRILNRLDASRSSQEFNVRYGNCLTSVKTKVSGLDETRATTLVIWATTFWTNHSAGEMDEYIR